VGASDAGWEIRAVSLRLGLYGRGSKRLLTSWTPVGDVPKTDGALAILEGSHRFDELIGGYGSIDVDDARTTKGFKGSYTADPTAVQRQYGGRWLTTDFEAGDLLVFTMHTMHCSLDNRSAANRVRSSVDTRYQPADEPADERWVGDNPIGHGEAAKRG
jgi:ectoine hydroxylase-related dioxygenase (phytanoyl-CoA dioxygenase family)